MDSVGGPALASSLVPPYFFSALFFLLIYATTSVAQEPADPVRAASGRADLSAGLGLDMLLRRPTSDDWLLRRSASYEYDGTARTRQQIELALKLAAGEKAPATNELPIDTDADTRPDAWIYFENGKPAFVELDQAETGCHDLRGDIRFEPWNVQRHERAFLSPPVKSSVGNATPLALNSLFDWAAATPARGPSNEALLPVAKSVVTSFASEAAALSKTSADAALVKSLSDAAARALKLFPKFSEIHRQEGLAKTLQIHKGVQIVYRPYDLDKVAGSEVVAGYAPWGVECIQFHQGDWLEGTNSERDSRSKPKDRYTQVFLRSGEVAGIDLGGRRFFPLGGYWLRVAVAPREPLAEKLLLPAYLDYRAGRWYQAAAKWKQLVLAATLLGDIRLDELGRPVGQLLDSGEPWDFDADGFSAASLFEFGRSQAMRGESPEVFALAEDSAKGGNFDEALALYALAVRFTEKEGKTLRKVLALERMGALHQRLGNYDRAIECLFQSLDLESSLGYAADVIENVRTLAQDPDDPVIMKRTMEIRTHAMAVNRCGKLATIAAHYVDLGELDRSKMYLAEAERIAPPLGNRYLDADLLCLRAKLDLAESRTELARERLTRAFQIIEKQIAEQQQSPYRKERFEKGESIHTFQIFEAKSRFEVDLMAETHPLAYQALAAGLLAEANMQRAVELQESNAKQSAQLLVDAHAWQTKAQFLSRIAGDLEGQLVGDLRLAAIVAQQGEYAEALDGAKQVIEKSKVQGKFELLWRALSLTGAAHKARGETVEAIVAYEAAAKEIESLRARLHSEPVRRGFFGSKIEVYEELARLYITAVAKENDAARSQGAERVWQCVERAKARTLLDTVGGQQLKLKGEAVAEATKQAPLLLQPGALRTAPEDAHEALAVLSDRPLLQEVASFSAVQPANLAALAAVLGPQDVLIEYFATRDELLAAVVFQGRVDLVPIPGYPSEVLRNDVENYRRQIEDPRGVYEPTGRRLYERLLAPCLKGRSKIERICIVPGGSLHYLPFAALVLPDGKFLVERVPVFTAPSASALVYAYHRRSAEPPAAGTGALVVADPLPQQGFAALPYAAREGREVRSLARESPGLLSGKGATETAVVAALADARCFHFAGHTHLPSAAPLRAALMCTEDIDRDGRLEVREILELNLRHCDLAVLSACETRLGRWSRGDEIVGLERAFLRAGVPTVVTSLWKVDDAATQALMVEFYQNLWTKKQGKLEALRGAQLALLDGRLKPQVDEAVRALGIPAPLPDGGKTTSSTRHPLYWAAFTLSGDWR